jgi:hypothetical protein
LSEPQNWIPMFLTPVQFVCYLTFATCTGVLGLTTLSTINNSEDGQVNVHALGISRAE